VSVQELERCPTQALAFGVSDEGSEQPSVGQAAGTAARFTVTRDSLQLAIPRPPRRWQVHPPELGDPGASTVEVIKGCWTASGSGRKSDLL
jgi:hypothetical protein